MNKKRILIVEDEKAMAKILHLKLQHEGIESDIVHNGKDGLEKMRTNTYDLVVLDLIMPIMDGFTVLETMQVENITTPVIVASNLSQEGDLERASSMGAKDYFIKSNTPLLDIVNRIKKFIA